MKNSMINEKIKNLNHHYVHPSYSLELELSRQVSLGNYEEAMSVMHHFQILEGPKLAYNPIRSKQNSMIALCTVLTRAAIKGGVHTEDAFDMSDAVIKNTEMLETINELCEYELQMIKDFVDLVKKRANKYEYPSSVIVDYIYQNITSKININDLCSVTRLSPDYISRVFAKQVGMNVTDYIQLKKVEASKSFLLYDDMSVAYIAVLFDFCNHGYYSRIFKKHTGMTPLEFRKNKNTKS